MFGQSVKLVDFGLATTDPISSDFGCGSTFYLSPGKVIHLHCSTSIVKDTVYICIVPWALVVGRKDWEVHG